MIRLKTEIPVYGGYTIARGDSTGDGGVIFVRGALPGETVNAMVNEKKKDYSIATVSEVLEPSEMRAEPFCSHFGSSGCGGCHLQHAAYPGQVAMKNAIIVDSFKRIAGIETVPAEPLAGGDTHYRHRAQFKVSAEGAVGFFREGTRDVEPVRQCPLLVENVNDCLEKIRSLPLDGVKEIHVTSSDGSFDDGPSAFIKGREFDEDLAREYADAGFDTVYFDDGSYRGKGYVSFDLSGFKYTVSPLSFFQSNWRLNLRAVLASRQLLGPLSEKFLLDIYAGGGNFSIPLSTEADRITCIEESGPSIKDALRNLELNGIKNMNFIKSAFERFQGKGQKPFDAAIVDPPRPGLSREAVKKLLELLPERLLYISCNPATLARDVKKFLEKYKVETVRLADFFPHTYHMEVICLLTRV